jgi:peroxiredoxin
MRRLSLFSSTLLLLALLVSSAKRDIFAEEKPIVWSAAEQPLADQIRALRKLPDDTRAQTTKDLAASIARLPVTPNKLRLAGSLANLSTEGDFGHDTLQAVANTLQSALREQPQPEVDGNPAPGYMELATLARYEHVQLSLDSPELAKAQAQLEAADAHRQQADFSLHDLHKQTWQLHKLKGKVVLVNFWATWCPPCRKEMPDLNALYGEFKDRGLVILAISDEDAAKVAPFIQERGIAYPVLLDPGDVVNKQFEIEGIPKSFVYDREGKLVAQSIDMRTRHQFLEMLAQAGLR